jgi:hypothetical protein
MDGIFILIFCAWREGERTRNRRATKIAGSILFIHNSFGDECDINRIEIIA